MTGTVAGSPDPRQRRRRRRTRDDLIALIREAARDLFAQRGYAATTTREIARMADVSETLVFRYFTDKSTLFDEVVTAPFGRMMDDFITKNPDPTTEGYRTTVVRQFTRQVYEFFEANQPLFQAIMSGPVEGGAPSLKGLDRFFTMAARHVERRYEKAGETPPFDLRIAVRVGLGMIAASVLMHGSLFPDAAPEREALIDTLEGMVELALSGPALD
ncbi:MAG: TetR/AcrR family transcriptional regulator [Sphingomonas sp.]